MEPFQDLVIARAELLIDDGTIVGVERAVVVEFLETIRFHRELGSQHNLRRANDERERLAARLEQYQRRP